MDLPDNGASAQNPVHKASARDLFLFWGCFAALIATAFGFIIRTQIIDDWGQQFDLSETQKGEIFGVGLWPFAVSIVLFSLIIDAIGYGKAMIFAFVCHVTSAVVTIFTPELAEMLATKTSSGEADPESIKSTAYWILYGGTFIVALGNGTIEAVINPVVATIFSHAKTKWLSMLHAGWPGGLVLGGLLAIGLSDSSGFDLKGALGLGEEVETWQLQVGLIFIPVLLYGLMMLFSKFPVNERVAANVSYRDMLKEVGFLGALIITAMIVFEVGRVFEESGLLFSEGAVILPGLTEQTVDINGYDTPVNLLIKAGTILVISGIFGIATLSLGQPLFIFLLLIMVPLATTELGVDSWITDLMTPVMQNLGEQAGNDLLKEGGLILIYTSLIMMSLRLFAAGPIVKATGGPLGLLVVSSITAALGLVSLSFATGAIVVLVAATLYGVGKTFFWPSMLGITAEQFPKGGALTLNTIAGVGMLAVGVLGNPFLGYLVDTRVTEDLRANQEQIAQEVVTEEPKVSIFGKYQPVNDEAVQSLNIEQQEIVSSTIADVKQTSLRTVALLPVGMLVCYLILIGYFKLRGGYRPEMLITKEEEVDLLAGGSEGPGEA